MRKFLVLFLPVLAFLILACSVNAQSSVPEINGDYQDPENKKIRVRVFVHNPKIDVSVQNVCSSDSSSDAQVGVTGWRIPGVAWNYKINASSAPSSVSSNLATIAANSFQEWSNAIGTGASKPTFVFGGQTSATKSSYDGQNIIAWGRTSGTALAVTYTRYYTSTGQVVDVDTIFNKKFSWSWNTCNNSYDAQNILTHELGHWVGLRDEYTVSFVENTMYGYGAKNETKKNTLTNGDILGLTSIYN